jgi:hypothetical protein
MAGSSVFNPATGATDNLIDPGPGSVPVGPTGRAATISAANDAIETVEVALIALYNTVENLPSGGGGSGLSFTVAGGIPTFTTGAGTTTITETNGIPTFTQ